mmetsp:Transcript_24932/g.53117  ORF Transcript_24932/g.53117 Transcript_24932/m.53117 type:complete len:247 (-) Transcript_24932:842-1582(-)
MAILMPGSAISAVATGTHTPQVTRSNSILDPLLSLANIPSLALSMGPYISFTVVATSSRRKNSPAHSPLDPPSSSFPMDSLERRMGMMATRANADSASGPLRSNARPRRHDEMVSRSTCWTRRRCSSFNCLLRPLSCRPLSSSSSQSFSSSFKRRTLASRLSSLPARHLAVSLSSLRMRGASFIRNRDFSMTTPLMPPSALTSLREGRMLALSESFEASTAPPLIIAMAETSSELDWSSCRRWRVV